MCVQVHMQTTQRTLVFASPLLVLFLLLVGCTSETTAASEPEPGVPDASSTQMVTWPPGASTALALGPEFAINLPAEWSVNQELQPSQTRSSGCSQQHATVTNGETTVHLFVNHQTCTNGNPVNGSSPTFTNAKDIRIVDYLESHNVRTGKAVTLSFGESFCTNECWDEMTPGLLLELASPTKEGMTALVLVGGDETTRLQLAAALEQTAVA